MMKGNCGPSRAAPIFPYEASTISLPAHLSTADADLIEECRLRSLALLRQNQNEHGVLAARANKSARDRGYTAIFARDAAICAIGMALSGDEQLAAQAPRSLHTLAAHQAPNGQLPKFVDTERNEPDFWYLGCIDATLWWLYAIDFLDRRQSGLRAMYQRQIELALQWLLAQEHQRFYLLQQNEASDWADIMPRSGFVLYTNTLWYDIKRRYGLAHARETHDNFNELFHPFSADPAALDEYRRGRLLADYAIREAGQRELYLSFVNFSFFGGEGDVFGNVLALLLGLADGPSTDRVVGSLLAQGAGDPYPVRSVCEPIQQASFLWRPYMSRHEQNFAWQYHNGGIWPFVGGFWVCALVGAGRKEEAASALAALARANALAEWRFSEWLHGQTYAASGMEGQSWNAAAFVMAESAVRSGVSPLHLS